jgi:hypothetical protein
MKEFSGVDTLQSVNSQVTRSSIEFTQAEVCIT